MACIHGLSPRDCQHRACSSSATAMAESNPSKLESDSSEGSGSSEEEESSDEVEVVVDDLRSTNLGGSGQKNPAVKKGM